MKGEFEEKITNAKETDSLQLLMALLSAEAGELVKYIIVDGVEDCKSNSSSTSAKQTAPSPIQFVN